MNASMTSGRPQHYSRPFRLYSGEAGGTPTTPPPDDGPTWDEAIDSLLKARKLADDWDGLGAVAPPSDAVDKALRVAQTYRGQGMPAPDFAHATAGGSVTLEWHGPGLYSEVRVGATGPAEWVAIHRASGAVSRGVV